MAQSLAAFYMDLDDSASGNPLQRTTVVVTSEFGRELRQNADQGTEHGFGNVMMVLGGAVNGGLYGTFPGLHEDQLFDGTDVAATEALDRLVERSAAVPAGSDGLVCLPLIAFSLQGDERRNIYYNAERFGSNPLDPARQAIDEIDVFLRLGNFRPIGRFFDYTEHAWVFEAAEATGCPAADFPIFPLREWEAAD